MAKFAWYSIESIKECVPFEIKALNTIQYATKDNKKIILFAGDYYAIKLEETALVIFSMYTIIYIEFKNASAFFINYLE